MGKHGDDWSGERHLWPGYFIVPLMLGFAFQTWGARTVQLGPLEVACR